MYESRAHKNGNLSNSN